MLTDEQLAATLGHVCEHWEKRRKAAQEGHSPTHAFTIALSREAGTPADAVARELGQRLGWPVYNRELLDLIAHDLGVRTQLLESVDEKRLPWLLDAFDLINEAPQVTESGYVEYLIKTVLALETHGECIIVGRGAAFILPALTTLRVRLMAPLEDRIARLSRKLGVSHKEAQRRAAAIDRDRKRFVQEMVAENRAGTLLYDLTLNTTRFSVAACAQVIMEALRQQQAHAAETGQESTPSS